MVNFIQRIVEVQTSPLQICLIDLLFDVVYEVVMDNKWYNHEHQPHIYTSSMASTAGPPPPSPPHQDGQIVQQQDNSVEDSS